MGNNCIVVAPADVRVARTQLPTPIQKLAARRSCMRIKNAVACVALHSHSGFLAPPCPVGSKKSSSTSTVTYNLARPRPGRSHFYDAGARRTVVVCAQKSQRLLDLDCTLPPDPASGCLCGWGSKQKDGSTVVGGHSRRVSPRTLLHGFLGGLPGSDS
jgi:hypothetical protein